MANVSQLQPTAIPQVHRSSTVPTEKGADFLALRLLNRRARVRLSSEPLDLSLVPGKACLFAIANSKGWFAAVTRDTSGASVLILSPLPDLRSAFASASADDDGPYQPKRRIPINGTTPMFLTFACNDTRVLLGLADGFILVYDSDQLISSGGGLVSPTHSFTASPSTVLLSIQPNPGDIPELVAILRDCTNSPGSLAVELLDVQKFVSSGGWMAGKSPSTTPTSISWSPKGKQLALGLQSGDIVTYSPTATATPKFSIPHPPSANNMSAIFIQWLSTSSFHAIYTPPGQLAPDVEQVHFHLSLDSKSNSAQDVRFNSPYLPFPGLRPPGAFAVCLRGWDPSKVLLFVGDSTASDIGVFGSMTGITGESWCNLSLEETSTPSLPLDKDQNDTILLGLDVDLTNDSSYRHSTASGEALDLPASPIMYAYASDGTIIGWYILNVNGKSYPGMVTGSDAPSTMLMASSMVREPSVDMLTTPAISPITSTSPKTSVFQPPPTTFGATFGQSSAFGPQSSAFGQPSFGQSAFGRLPAATSSLGSAIQTPFGQPAASPFDSAASSSGAFGAFASTGPAKFGQSTLSGFGAPAQTLAFQTLAEPASQESMVSDDGPSLGGLGLGAANSQVADSKPSIFGNTSVQLSSSQPSTGHTSIKPGTGFGAFASFDQKKSPFANPASAFASTTQLSPAFGPSPFQIKPEGPLSNTVASTQPSSSVGQSGFNHTAPTFGQSSFGRPALTRSSFGQPPADPAMLGQSSFATAATTSTSTGGAFAAFASSTQIAFGAVATNNNNSAKPVWATNDSPKLDQPQASGGASKAVFEESKVPTPTPKIPFAAGGTATSTPLNAAPLAVASPSSFPTTSHLAARESAVRDDTSRSPSPSPTQQDDPSLFFTSSTVGPATGAFSNLKTIPSAFVKPASGFFGEVSKDSPFLSPKPPESKPASAFSLAATPTSTPPKPSSAIPTFGTPSMPGGTLKSLFDPAIAAPAQPATTPGGGSFNAFSHKGSGFAAYSSGGNKSFSDILRAVWEESEESSGGGPFVSALGDHAARTSPQVPLVTTPCKEPLKRPLVSPTTTELDKEEALAPKVKASENGASGAQGRLTEPILVQEPSLESISSSTSSSFVNISTEEGEVIEEGTTTEGGLQDDTESFLSDSSESDVSEEESEHPSEEDVEKQSKPSEIHLPASPTPTRSPSTTPKAEPPKITVEALPPPQLPLHPGGVPRVSPVRELSTTPPGSPVKNGAPVPSPVQGPVPKPLPPATSPFNPAPRPNNRPIRSSPLASTPFVPDGGSETSPPLSRSAPPAITAQSTAPNISFGQWTSLTTVEPEGSEPGLSPRCKTPPLLSIISGAGASANVTPTIIPAPSLSPFTLPSILPPFSAGAGAPNLWATPPKSVEATPSVSFNSPFGPKKLVETAPSTNSVAPSVPKSPLVTPVSTLSLPLPTAPTPEQGMQAECAFLLRTLNKEFEDLRLLATAAAAKTVELKKTSGITPRKADLGDARKWVFGDIKEYGRLLADVQTDVKELKSQRGSLRKVLRELDSNMLKAGTRKEEIIRFNRAKTDAEFSKMLKVRTLGPEYMETQSQLRRDIRAIRDRVQKLEDHLQVSKKRINELKLGRPSLRAPSLDTMNRTFRNIDIAIDQQKQEVTKLRLRMAKLDITEGVGARDKLGRSSSKQPKNVTPNVAATTAAALNAERSAHRLKRALLATRTQPLLNTVATATPVPTSSQTPQKATAVKPEVGTVEDVSPLPTAPTMNFPTCLPVWTPLSPSEFGESLSHDISPSRNRGGSKHHQKPIVLKKNNSPAGAAQTSPFEWKPVAPIKPMSSLPFAIRPTGST
ncbi:hypothetical protein PAXRUDRAFT_833034 [Paxillus rubicundulus Ve08.2h10]|uniref:Nucleoporin Nup159/Nup146 N-terminal domain-containing protein n=1 Tax=Paxillus rubicundulus Ve08.2h10 TaxID=930991 RepID=A0A0D0CZP3_9AGAM|nr:hypothetical protein PAXRUDRAFT_833034 [Paxillus rubicundulus Ve08.2h10]